MQESVARLVHPILAHGLALRDRLNRGETPSLPDEQARLVGLLDAGEGQRLPDFHGDPEDKRKSEAGRLLQAGESGGGRFLGLRYALVCWLDEIFVLGSNANWAADWNEAKLEVRLYDGNDRAWRFWEQAQLATTRQSPDALEGMLLCVLLGFSGERADDLPTLSGWVATTRLQLSKGRPGAAWSAPPGLEPDINVPPLEGRPRLRTMLLVACGVLLALVPLVALLLARRWS